MNIPDLYTTPNRSVRIPVFYGMIGGGFSSTYAPAKVLMSSSNLTTLVGSNLISFTDDDAKRFLKAAQAQRIFVSVFYSILIKREIPWNIYAALEGYPEQIDIETFIENETRAFPFYTQFDTLFESFTERSSSEEITAMITNLQTLNTSLSQMLARMETALDISRNGNLQQIATEAEQNAKRSADTTYYSLLYKLSTLNLLDSFDRSQMDTPAPVIKARPTSRFSKRRPVSRFSK